MIALLPLMTGGRCPPPARPLPRCRAESAAQAPPDGRLPGGRAPLAPLMRRWVRRTSGALLLLSALIGSAEAKTVEKAPPPPPAPLIEAPPAPTGPDRSTPPAVQPGTPLSNATLERHALWDGLDVQLAHVDGLRRDQVQVSLHQGSVALCGGPSPACGALGDLLGVATKTTSAADLEEELVLLDAELHGRMGLRDTSLLLEVPPEKLSDGLGVLREALVTPAFPKDELKLHVRDTLLQYQVQWPSDPGALARLVRDYAWFPADSPYGARPDLAGWKKLKPKALDSAYAAALANGPATVLVISARPWSELEPLLRGALQGVGHPGSRPAAPAVAPPAKTTVIAVNLPGQAQASLRLRLAAPAAASPERAAFQAVHFALAGSFLSRINANLREEKGWTYGVHGRYSALPAFGAWDVSVDVAAENLAGAVTEIQGELQRMVDGGPTPSELSAAAVDQVQTWNTRLMTSDSAEGWYAELLDQDDSVEAARARVDAQGAVTAEAARAEAAKILGADAPRLWVIVGDKEKLQPQLQKLGWTPTWVEAAPAALGQLPPG